MSVARLFAGLICFGLALAASPPFAHADDEEQARLAARQLAAAQLPSGLLDFDFDFLAGGPRSPATDPVGRVAVIARQSGTAFLLAKYYGWSKDDAVVGPLARLIQTLGSFSVPVGKSTAQRLMESTGVLFVPAGRYKLRKALDALGLLYDRVGDGRLVTLDRRYDLAWAGTTALALLAELNYYRATHDDRFASLRGSWLAGLMALHVPDWGFRAYPTSIERAVYSDGEVWLALSTYAEIFPQNDEVQRVLHEYDGRMIRIYSAAPTLDFFSWGIMSAAARLATTSDEKFATFLAAQSRYLLDREGDWPPNDNTCSLIEGLATAARVLSARGAPDKDLIDHIRGRIDREMAKNRNLQIRPGAGRIDLPGGASLSSPKLSDYAGAFTAGVDQPYTRIDYTAHCISAFVELLGGQNR